MTIVKSREIAFGNIEHIIVDIVLFDWYLIFGSVNVPIQVKLAI